MVPIMPDRATIHISEQKKTEIRTNRQPGRLDELDSNVAGSTGMDGESKRTSFVSEIGPVELIGDRTIRTDLVVDHVQRLIDTMECYQQKLTKEDVCLEEIIPIIEKMTAESESLSEVSKQLASADSLRSIVNQSLILSSAEIVKFKSGFFDRR